MICWGKCRYSKGKEQRVREKQGDSLKLMSWDRSWWGSGEGGGAGVCCEDYEWSWMYEMTASGYILVYKVLTPKCKSVWPLKVEVMIMFELESR